MSQKFDLNNVTLDRRNFLGLFGASALVLGLAGCGSESASGSSSAGSADDSNSGEVTKIIIGTEGTYAPYSYVDDDGTITGFDVEVARAIGEKLDGYEFEFQTIEWASMFASLDADKIKTISNQVGLNKEREAKYLFTETPYNYAVGAIAFKKGRTDIQSVEDLQGKTVEGITASDWSAWVADYSAEHGDSITVLYTDNNTTMVQDVVNGRADATFNNSVSLQQAIDEQGLDLDLIVVPDARLVPIYFPFQSNDEGVELRLLFDDAIKELIEDGTIPSISEKFLGADYSTEEAIAKITF